MKKLAFVVALGLAGLLGYNYHASGEWTLIPGGAVSAAETQLRNLEKDLASARKQVGQAARSASLSGMDASADIEIARRTVAQIEKSAKALRNRLDSVKLKKRLDRLVDEAEAFKQSLQ